MVVIKLKKIPLFCKCGGIIKQKHIKKLVGHKAFGARAFIARISDGECVRCNQRYLKDRRD